MKIATVHCVYKPRCFSVMFPPMIVKMCYKYNILIFCCLMKIATAYPCCFDSIVFSMIM